MNPHLHRAQVLIEQSRFDLAEAELRQLLASNPDEAFGHALLGVVLLEQKKLPEATEAAKVAIGLAPDFSYAHYTLARVMHERDRLAEALVAIEEAIRLDPTEPAYHALLAGIRLGQKRWAEALAAAEQGLQHDASHVGCTNLRAIALVNLGRRAEAGATISTALSRDPENAVTHANEGWRLLHESKIEEALVHFRESLRLDPGNEWGRAGLVEALKARHFIYALMLRYFLWMSRLSGGAQWGIILAGYIGSRLLGELAKAQPALAPWLLPIRILYVLFVLLTWTADPLFNLVLRFSRYGRHALTPEQKVAVNWFAASLFLGLGMLGWFLVTAQPVGLIGALVFGLLLMPLTAVFKCQPGWPRWSMAIITGLVAACGVASLVLTGRDHPFLGLFLLGVFLSLWAGNVLMLQQPKR